MDWQFILTCVAIALAASYIVRRGVLALRPSKNGCAGGCGCAKTKSDTPKQPALIAPEELVLRQRKTHG